MGRFRVRSSCVAMVFAVLSFPVFPSPAGSRMPFPAEWRRHFGDDTSWASPGFDDSGWQPVTLPAKADREASGGNRVLWLRGHFRLDSPLRGERLYVLAGKMEGALEFYVNGMLVYTHGTFPPDYSYHSASPKQFIVPPEMLDADGENLLCMRMFTESGVFPVSPIMLGSSADYTFDTFILRALNEDINVVFSALSLFIAAYFIMQYAGNRRRRENLFYALANFCFSGYFFVIGFDYNFLPVVMELRFAKSLLVPAVTFLTLFFFEFFDAFRSKRFRFSVGAVGMATMVPYYVIPKDTVQINEIFTLLLVLVLVAIVLMVTVTVRAVRLRRPDSLPVAVGIVFALAFSMFDIVSQFRGIDPVAWLQGVGIFCLDLSVFASLSLRSIRTERSLVRYTAEAEEKTARLETFLDRVNEASDEASATNREVSATIGRISDLMSGIAVQSGSITANVETQSSVVANTRSTVMDQISGIDDVFRGLELQAKHVQEISATLEEMLAGIQSMTDNLRGTAEFAEHLGHITADGKKAVEASNDAMARIETVSSLIYEIINTVDDLAERTNLLAINAAIEAANSGMAGKGFAVVAGEIKRLAHASGESVRKIGEYVTDIAGSIRRGAEVNGEVRTILSDINDKTISTVDRVQEAYHAVQEQKQASEDVLRNVDSLKAASEGIRMQAGSQQEGGKNIRRYLDELTKISETVKSSILEISSENRDLESLVQAVKRLSVKSEETVSRLTELLSHRS